MACVTPEEVCQQVVRRIYALKAAAARRRPLKSIEPTDPELLEQTLPEDTTYRLRAVIRHELLHFGIRP